MSEVTEGFDNVIGGGLTLKGGLSLSKPAKRKKSHKKKKEKKHKKSDKKSKHKDHKDKRVRFQTGDLDDGDGGGSDGGAEAGAAAQTELAIIEDGAAGGGGGGGGTKQEEEPYDPMKDPSLTATQRKHLEAQRKRYGALADQTFKFTHRQRIEKFNTMLANLSEHHDVPKVGNAGMG